MANDVLYTVKAGDTLSKIAAEHGTTVSKLVTLNNLKSPDFLYVGQVLVISRGGLGEPVKVQVSNTNQATILQFGLLSTSGSTLFATWEWTKENTKAYQVKWEYTTTTRPSTWLIGSSTSVSVDANDPNASKQSTFNIPSDALRIRFMVLPISESKGSYGTSSVYWTASWSTAQYYNVRNNPPTVPPVPSIEITDNKLLTKLENLSVNATVIQFQVLKRNDTRFDQFAISNTTIQYVDATDAENRTNGYARYSCYVDANGEYKVRARSVRNNEYSDWSDYSASAYSTPTAPSGITEIRASSATSVYLKWDKVDTAASYDIQYATDAAKLEGSDEATIKSGVTTTYYDISGLEPGKEYFFRVRSVRESVVSEWSPSVSVIVGKKPGVPTTWCSSTTVITGEPLILYWVHNSEDGSSQTEAKLELTIGGMIEEFVIPNTGTEEERDKISSYEFDTTGLTYGTTIAWRVCTKGVHADYSEWSTQRHVDIYAPPSLTLSVSDSKGSQVGSLTALPIKIDAVAGPITQKPVGYHVTITANESYDTLDSIGNSQTIAKGAAIFSKHYDISDKLSIQLSAGDLYLENNVEYTVSCSVVMDSGLTAEASKTFVTAWSTDGYWPNAEVTIDTDSYTATIRPYCMDEKGTLVKEYTLSVYRRNFDGTFTELISGLENDGATCITDPHPALDYARYRIVAMSTTTGAVCYYDMPGIRVGGIAIVLQWDESWSAYDTPDSVIPVEPSWTGSMLTLPYNIDIREDTKPDVAHVEYIGRKYPVGYHGTQLGESATWSTVIDKKDAETLYGLRRLSRWNGNVYVREPSGSGYWATIVVGLDIKHTDLVIPVTLNITRVEGGV